MKTYRQSRRGLIFVQIALLASSVAVIIFSSIYLVRYPMFMYLVSGIFCFGAFAYGSIFLPLSISKTSYTISEECITKLCGVIFTKKVCLSLKSVQYVTRLSPPLSKYTGLCFIKIASQGANMRLLLLDEEDSLEIFFLIGKSIREGHYDKHRSDA